MALRRLPRAAALFLLVLAVGACSDTSLLGLGHRSSDWIAEPTVPTTIRVVTTVPVVMDGSELIWFNDDIESDINAPRETLRAQIFARSQGDLIIQASRAEIATLLHDVEFPNSVPTSAEYVTSQIVFDNDGSISADPRVGFGIWSSEPYTRSRSVAQIAVLWVAADEKGANQVAKNPGDVSCGRFSDRATIGCEIDELRGKPVWKLESQNGLTMVWFKGTYRYELFGRDFVPEPALKQMINSFRPIDDLDRIQG